MRIGIFADTHDHLDHIRRAVALFNQRGCELVVFAGDLVSTFAIPPLRKLNCPVVASFGDNEGNRRGVQAGMSILGPVADPPFGFRAADGTRFLVTHQRELLRRAGSEADSVDGAQIVIYAHTHRPRIERDARGRLWINPGETSGWTYRDPTVVVFDSGTQDAELIHLNELARNAE
jgi:putative phosphoesterase